MTNPRLKNRSNKKGFEASLPDMGLCNLTSLSVGDNPSSTELRERIRAASFLGTLQAGFTDFFYLRPEWKENAEKRPLLGVSLTRLSSMNIRDIASINELAILSNLETLNAQMIKEEVNKKNRFLKLREIAKYQLSVLNEKDFMKALKKLNDDVYIEQKKRLEK